MWCNRRNAKHKRSHGPIRKTQKVLKQKYEMMSINHKMGSIYLPQLDMKNMHIYTESNSSSRKRFHKESARKSPVQYLEHSSISFRNIGRAARVVDAHRLEDSCITGSHMRVQAEVKSDFVPAECTGFVQ